MGDSDENYDYSYESSDAGSDEGSLSEADYSSLNEAEPSRRKVGTELSLYP